VSSNLRLPFSDYVAAISQKLIMGLPRRNQRRSFDAWSSAIKVFTKALDLAHSFAQDGHDTDVAIRQHFPAHHLVFVSIEEATDAQVGGDRTRDEAVVGSPVKRGEQAFDLAFSPPTM
jgi:hypothetical protein